MVANRFYGPICQVRNWFETTGGVHGASNASGGTAKQATVTAPCWFDVLPIPARVYAPDADFGRLRAAGGTTTLSSATIVTAYAWPYGPASNAEQYIATIGGHRIEIFRPVGSPSALPTAQQVCDALHAVPATQRTHTRRVMLCPTPHPRTTARSTLEGEAGSGDVTLFPSTRTISQNRVDNVIMHEIGHNYQGSLWQSAGDVADWTNTAARDSRSPSTYAQSNSGDDFCEFLIIFNTVRGTTCEASASTLYQHRWAKMLTY